MAYQDNQYHDVVRMSCGRGWETCAGGSDVQRTVSRLRLW